MPVTDEYWKGVKQSFRFLKEFFLGEDREKVKEGAKAGKLIQRNALDGYFLNEAIQFLRLSIINLLSYKYILKGNYYAWAKVTLYYSYFYAINCLLRLQKYAIVHINYFGESQLVIAIDRCRDNRYYTMRTCGRNQHDLIWKTFEQYYPDLISEGIGKFFRDERMRWNYDLFYASQTLDEYSIDYAQTRLRTNFIDPDYFRSRGSIDADEYYSELMADTGFEEVGAWNFIQHALEKFSNIGSKEVLTNILDDISKIDSSQDMKEVIISMISDLISSMHEPDEHKDI